MEKNKAEHHYILIVAGGSGTRLYPRSRDGKPKQFQSIIGKKTLIEQTYDRAIKIVGADHIYVSVNKKYLDLVREFLPHIPLKNIISEPVKRNTAPAMALANEIIRKRDPGALIASLHSDHLVLRPDIFIKTIKSALEIIDRENDTIATIGIQPTSPHTGYGYIERDKKHSDINEFASYKVLKFIEKPNRERALDYLRQGTFYWNAGYFIWKALHMKDEFQRLQPGISAGISKIVTSENSASYNKVLDKEFAKLPDMAIDTAIMEKAKKLLVIPADLGWSDVGSWDSVSDLLDHDAKTAEGNYLEGLVIPIDTHNSVILSNSSKKLTATIGLDNIIVVVTDDAIVISQKGRTEEIKKVVEELKNRKLDHLL
jgi:mannose-1-phosphate guanylyltransferase